MEPNSEDVARELALIAAVFQMDPRNKATLTKAAKLIEWQAAEYVRLRAEVERLREALEPFEELACEGNWDQPDDTKVIVHAGRATCYWLTLADLRRARKALEGGE